MFSAELITEDATAKSGYASTNAYLNKSGGKYAKNIKKPANYSFIFVLSMILGGVLSRILAGPQALCTGHGGAGSLATRPANAMFTPLSVGSWP